MLCCVQVKIAAEGISRPRSAFTFRCISREASGKHGVSSGWLEKMAAVTATSFIYRIVFDLLGGGRRAESVF